MIVSRGVETMFLIVVHFLRSPREPGVFMIKRVKALENELI